MIKGCLLTVIGVFVAVVLVITALLVAGLFAAYVMLMAMLAMRLVHWGWSMAVRGREWERINAAQNDVKNDEVEESNEAKTAVHGEPDRDRAQAHRDPPGTPAYDGAGD